ncbi:hypothetical protein [Segniliparus rotundus]|uniref:hypothetical protein n=1 Tax=Segniliparus rotundus TaxID=286802 RepID=UPI00059E2A05|nr:hypothetical protein [Segniliparus rotundus]
MKKAPAAAVKSVRSFLAAHGGSGNVLLQNIGQAGVRVTLVGKDGVLGDNVVRDMATAKALVAAVDGLEEPGEWTRDLVSAATPAPGHARKMAGWIANA